jgi:hypothetical protein
LVHKNQPDNLTDEGLIQPACTVSVTELGHCILADSRLSPSYSSQGCHSVRSRRTGCCQYFLALGFDPDPREGLAAAESIYRQLVGRIFSTSGLILTDHRTAFQVVSL